MDNYNKSSILPMRDIQSESLLDNLKEELFDSQKLLFCDHWRSHGWSKKAHHVKRVWYFLYKQETMSEIHGKCLNLFDFKKNRLVINVNTKKKYAFCTKERTREGKNDKKPETKAN